MRTIWKSDRKTRTFGGAWNIPGVKGGGSLAVVALALLLAGCGAPRPVKYYQLTYPASALAAQDAIETTLLVRSFEASHLYLDDRIVYGYDSPEMGAYQTQRWAEPPVEMLRDALVRGFRSSGRFRAVYSMRSDINGQFVLAGHLYDFREVDTSGGVLARLNFEARLRDRKSGTTVWSHVYSHDESASDKNVSAVAVAMDKNVQRSVQEIQAELEAYFRAHPVK